MDQSPNIQLTIDQLSQYINSFYEQETPNRQEIDQILLLWVRSPTSIPTSFEIIRSSNDRRLRFFAADSFHYHILQNVSIFSQEDLLEMANLFGSFVMAHQSQIDSPDVKYVLIVFADLCGMFPNFIDAVFKTFPPELFVLLMAILSEELNNSRHKFKANQQIEENFKIYKDQIYQIFANISFDLKWCQSFARLFHFYLLEIDFQCSPTYIIPFMDKIEMMTQNQSYFTCFISIAETAYKIDFFGDEPTLFLITNITQIAIKFLKANPIYASTIWCFIFDYSHSFLLSKDRIEFTELVFQSFFESIPSFFYENDDFIKVLTSFQQLILEQDSEDFDIFYPHELRLKNILTLLDVILTLYNQNNNHKINLDRLIFEINHFALSPFVVPIKQFIVSQPLSPGVLVLLSSQLFYNDNEIFVSVLNQILSLPEIPNEVFYFIKKLLAMNIIVPFIQQIIQLCLACLDKYTVLAVETLKKLSSYQKDAIIPYCYDLSISLLPTIPQFHIDQQRLLIQFFLNIFTENDLDKLEIIKSQILQNCSFAIQSLDLTQISFVINNISLLYRDFGERCDEFVIKYMAQIFPIIFHEFTPVAMRPDVVIQDSLCRLIKNVCIKCIPFPEVEDPIQRQQALVNEGAYAEIFQWVLTMMNQYLCGFHFTVLNSLKIYPFDETFQVICSITPNDHATIIEEMLSYIKFIFIKDLDKLWSLIPPQFFIMFISSDQNDVVVHILKFFRDINISSNEIKSMLMQTIILKIASGSSHRTSFYDILKTLLVIIHKDKSVFDMYVNMMNSAFPNVNSQNNYYALLWQLSQNEPNVIETLSNRKFEDMAKALRDIIYINQ